VSEKPSRIRKRVAILVVLLLLGGGAAAAYFFNVPIPGITQSKAEPTKTSQPTKHKVDLVKDAEPLQAFIVEDSSARADSPFLSEFEKDKELRADLKKAGHGFKIVDINDDVVRSKNLGPYVEGAGGTPALIVTDKQGTVYRFEPAPTTTKDLLAAISTPHTISIPEEVRKSLGIRRGGKDVVAVAKEAKFKRPLVLSASTMFDPSSLHRLKIRFTPAEIVRIESIKFNSGAGTQERKVQVGDYVEKGTPLAVLYSIDVGSKKNDLIDALVSYKFDNDLYQRAKNAAALPEVIIEGYRQKVQSDENTIKRSLKSLRLWRIPKEDIVAVYKEAEEIIKNDGKRKPEPEDDDDNELDPWGKVVLRAPASGYIVEQNVAEKETINDPTVALYQIANSDKLLVMANCPEEDIKELIELRKNLYKLKLPEMRWTLRPLGEPESDGISGPIEEIGQLVDPNTHTVPVKGRIENKDGILRASQYFTATIELPAPKDVVEIPANAIADDGKQAIVFVQDDPNRPVFTMRRVVITHRFEDRAFVRSQLSGKEMKLTPEERDQGLMPKQPLRKGERVLVSGLLELKKELDDLESEKAD
jgi:membrane fusion protein, heavy metal efflux system